MTVLIMTETKNNSNNIQAEVIQCCICMNNDSNCKTECNHSFCKVCIMKWYKKSKTCPVCRQPMHIFIINRTPEICMKAIKCNDYALQYISNEHQTEALCRIALGLQ
jgi:hypothetical protein